MWRAGWCIRCERNRVGLANSYVCEECLAEGRKRWERDVAKLNREGRSRLLRDSR